MQSLWACFCYAVNMSWIKYFKARLRRIKSRLLPWQCGGPLGASPQPRMYVRNEGQGSKIILDAFPTAHRVRIIFHGAESEDWVNAIQERDRVWKIIDATMDLTLQSCGALTECQVDVWLLDDQWCWCKCDFFPSLLWLYIPLPGPEGGYFTCLTRGRKF